MYTLTIAGDEIVGLTVHGPHMELVWDYLIMAYDCVEEYNDIQLSPEGEVNTKWWIYLYPLLFTDPERDSCFSIYQIRWIKKCGFLNGHNFF